jgi:hypothetical protein
MFRTRREMMKLLVAAPFLAPAFSSVLANAATPATKRLVIMMRYNGAPMEKWYPSSWGDFSGSCLASLNDAKLKSKLTVLKNMNNAFVGSGDAHAAGANGAFVSRFAGESGVSIDQYIANKMNFPTPRRNLALGVYSRGFDSITNTFFKAPGSAADINDDPYDSINKVFATLVPSAPGTNPDATTLLAKKKSILDALKDDLGRMSQNLVGAEKSKLEAHLALVRSSEQNLGTAMTNMGLTCKKLEVPATRYGVRDLAKLPEIARVQMDLVTVAMACDISRVFVIQMLSSYTNVGGGDVNLDWCGGANIAKDAKSGYRDGAGNPVLSLHQYHHAKRSDTRERAIYAAMNTTYASLFGELMKKLDAVPDGPGKTLLDNSISVLGSEYGGDSEDGDRHSGGNLPFLLGGGGGGFLKNNQMFDMQGKSHTQLLGTLLEYFGIEDGSGSKSTDFGNRSKGLSYASVAGLKA